MADLETGLNIPVGAYADKDSAKEAVNDLTKGVLSSLKNGYIEVPAEIKASFTRGSKELDKAQKDVINQWEKMSKEGFSSSEEYLDALITKYKKFKSLAGKEGKGNSKQTKWLTKNIGESLQPYLAQKRELEKIVASFKDSSKTVKKTPARKITHSYDKIQNDKLKGIKQVGPKGYKSNSGVDAGRTNNYEFRMSESSPYKSIGSYIAEKNRREEEKKSAASLKTWKDENYKPKQGGGRATTDKENAEINASKSLTELKKLIVAIEKGVEGITPEQVQTQLGIVKDLFQKNGKDLEETSIAIKNAIEKPYSDNANRRLGSTSGEEKGVGPGHETAKSTQKMIYDIWTKLIEATDPAVVYMKRFAKEMLEANTTLKKATNNMKKAFDETSAYSKTKTISSQSDSVKQIQALGTSLQSGLNATKSAINSNKDAISKQTQYDMIEHSAERAADSAEAQKNRDILNEVKEDAGTGFNTEAKADRAIEAFSGLQNLKDMMCPCKEVLESILLEIQGIAKNGVNITGKRTTTDKTTSPISGKGIELLQSIFNPSKQLLLPAPKPTIALAEHNKVAETNEWSRSKVSTTIKDPHSWVTKLKDAFAALTRTTANYKVIMSKTSEEQDKMSAERIKKYGLNRGMNPTDSGDKISIARRLSLFRGKDKFQDLFKDINLSKGIEVDTTAITDKLAKVLSGKEMFKYQTGGIGRNALGAMTGGLAFAFQPSLEKSRAQADAVNTIMANIRKAANDILQDIQSKESTLSGMKSSGDLQLGENGEVLESSTTEAKTLVLQLEESKNVLASILADAGAVDQVVSKTGGKLSRIIKRLGFTSPVLRKNNAILANINAGLDKNGKALKFQTRLAEMLNYSFQLMGRHLGQMVKRWLLMLNPITHIKKLFSDFSGYNTKWQRTMNVIKYNIRAIVRPAMDWIAQKLVNIIGFFDIISMKIQEAFGQIPISLFDQAAAQSEKIHEELEAGANVTAGFDELHDIGSDNTGANDLFGDIYKPQLSEEWKKLAEEIGDLFAGLIKGDLGFGEVMKRILEILWDGLKLIAKAIWDWFKQTAIGKWITENWKKLLLTLLGIFLGWQLLKIAGKLLWNAIFGKITEGGVTGLFGKVGTWIGNGLKWVGTKLWDLLGLTTFGQQMQVGFAQAFTGQGLIGAIKGGGATLGSVFAQAFIGVIGVAIAGASYAKGFDMAADDTSYNLGLKEGGGKDKDKKKSTGAYAVSGLGGAAGGALVGLAIGGPIGAAIGAGIGAIVGLITTSLAPAFEEAEVAARNMNNEMQKIEYYEGLVQGTQTQVSELDTLMGVLNETLQKQTEKVYAEGEELGITRTRMDELVGAVQDGTYHTGMLNENEMALAGSLEQLSYQQEKNKATSDKLTEAKKKLAKAEMDLAIAQDIEAGNYELAAARIELALASDVYNEEEATKKMIQLTKEADAGMRANLLADMSPDMKRNWEKYVTTTEQGKRDLAKIYSQMNEEERKAFSKSYEGEAGSAMRKAIDSMQKEINSASWDWSHPFKSLMSTFSGDWSWKANYASFDVGTNYVPNDGLAYLHQGEAVIPAKYNRPYSPNTSGLESAIASLSNQVAQINTQVGQGINVHGQFVQRGSDLVATVQKADNRLSNSVLNNKVYAR